MDESMLLTANEKQGIGPLQVNAYGDRFFYNLNPETFSEISATALYDTTFGTQLFNENTLYILIGTDSGLLPRYIETKGIPNGSRYIFIEPHDVFEALSAEGCFNDIDPRIACIHLEQWSDTIEAFKIMDFFYLDHVQVLETFCSKMDIINAYHELYWHINETISLLKWQNNFGLGSEVFSIRQLANLADNQSPAILLKDAFKGTTAIILAGGPSLDDALPWVQKHRENLIVFAVSRIAKRLQEVNISPDFIVTIDPSTESFDISKEMLTLGQQTVLLHSYHAVPTLVNQWPGTSFYLGARLPWTSTLNCENITAPGPTVSNTALNAAYLFGCTRIILAGLDLCFTPEGMTHAKGSNEHLAGPRFNLTTEEVETNDGSMAPSRRDFIAASEGLSAQAQEITTNKCRVINASPHAAKIKHVEYMPLSKIRLKPLQCSVPAIVSERLKQHHDPEIFKKMTLALKEARAQFNQIRRVTAKGKACAKSLSESPTGKNSAKHKQSLRRIEHQLQTTFESFSRFVKTFCIRRFLQITRPFNDTEKTIQEFHQTGIQFFESYQQGTTLLITLIDQALQRIQAREQESLSEPNWAMMIHQCVIDNAFGRVRKWQTLWPSDSLSEHIRSEFAILESRFVDTLANTNTRHFQEAQRDGNLSLVKPRADLLFKQNKADLLHALLTSLDKLPEQSATLPYRLLIEGYYAELQSELPVALEAYHQLVNLESLFMNDALLRISFISITLNDHDNAYLAMYCLAQRNPIWLPLCARMQQLRGEITDAVASYQAYILRFPEDIGVQLKLATLCMQENLSNASELLLNFILEKHPSNEIALHMKSQLLNNDGNCSLAFRLCEPQAKQTSEL